MSRKKTGKRVTSQAIRYGFIFSFLLHTVFVLASGPLFRPRPSELLIEVDLRSLPSTKEDNQAASQVQDQTQDQQTARDIPRPYIRPSAVPQTQNMKIADNMSPAPAPIISSTFSPAPALALPHGSTSPKTAYSAGAGEKIYVPVSDSEGRSGSGPYVPWSGSSGRSGGGSATVGQIMPVSIPQIPLQAKVAYEYPDQTIAYQRMIHRHIDDHKQFPPLAIRKGWEGNVGVRFLLHRDGRTEQIQVTRSSRIALLDDAAVAAVKNGNPFPSFPSGISEASLWIEVTLTFELRGGVI